jgi:hypothetical protein
MITGYEPATGYECKNEVGNKNNQGLTIRHNLQWQQCKVYVL